MLLPRRISLMLSGDGFKDSVEVRQKRAIATFKSIEELRQEFLYAQSFHTGQILGEEDDPTSNSSRL
jgi:hypothetical protein